MIGVLQLGLQATAARRIAAEPRPRRPDRAGRSCGSPIAPPWRSAVAPAGPGSARQHGPAARQPRHRRARRVRRRTDDDHGRPGRHPPGRAPVVPAGDRSTSPSVCPAARDRHRSHRCGGPPSSSAMLGVGLGAVAARAWSGWYALRRDRDAAQASDDHAARPIIRETVHNSPGAARVLRAVQRRRDRRPQRARRRTSAGLYAGGLIVTKAVLFLPQFVVVIAFPSMATADARRRALTRSLTLVGAARRGLHAGRAGCSRASRSSSSVATSTPTIEDRLWMFAVLGTVLVDAAAAGLLGAGPAGAAVGLPRLGCRWRVVVGAGVLVRHRHRAAHSVVVATDAAAVRRAPRAQLCTGCG